MSTTPFPGTYQQAIENQNAEALSTLPVPEPSVDLTVHRRTATHHGRTLLTLGHAAEYLVHSRMFLSAEPASQADTEAVHILMQLSRMVFNEYAQQVTANNPLETWMVGCLIKLFNSVVAASERGFSQGLLLERHHQPATLKFSYVSYACF